MRRALGSVSPGDWPYVILSTDLAGQTITLSSPLAYSATQSRHDH